MNQDTRRLEAIPLDWNALSEQQRNAVEASSRWLVDALGSIPPLKDRPEQFRQSGPVLDSNRRSQLGFIDGDRGMGKSSVLLTLQALTTEDDFFVEDNAKNRADKANKILTAVDRDRYPSTMKLHDGQRRRNVVWLETLDMEPLSKGVNLFAAILARIEKELDTRVNELPPMAAALAEPDGYAGAADKLQQLQQDAAIIWDRTDGGVYEGDPTTRALWVNQAEKAGLETNRRIGEVLDAMARTRWNRKSENPLFVLPVDDFDLAPCHCLELLRLIRMITTPRLFFLVAGNARIAEAVLKLRTEGDLLNLTNGKPLDSDEVRGNAAEIAANNMRKLLPPGQRVRLAEFRIDEALRIGENTPEGSLLENLKKVSFEVNQAPTGANTMSLAEFIALDKYQHKDQYLVIADWLGGTPRQALDYAGILSQLAENITKNNHQGKLDEQSKDELDNLLLSELVKEIRRQALEEWRIPYAQRERLAEMLDTSVNISLNMVSFLRVEHNYVKIELKKFEHGTLNRFIPTPIRVFTKTREEERESPAESQKVMPVARVYNHNEVDIQTKSEEKVVEIPNRLGASLLFAHDFAVSLWGGYLQHSPLTYSNEISGQKVGFFWETDNSTKPIVVSWYSPEWWTFRDAERFARHWSLHSDQSNSQYGLSWLAAILEVVLNEECKPGTKGISPERLKDFLTRLVNEKTQFTETASPKNKSTKPVKTDKQKPIRTARRVLIDSALLAIALLLTPESESDVNILEFEHSEIAFFQTIQEDSVLRNRILKVRARIWCEAWNNGAIDTPQRALLCELIAPRLAWNLTIREMDSILKELNIDDVTLPGLLNLSESNESKNKELSALKSFKQSFSERYKKLADRAKEKNRLDQLLKTAQYCFDAMPEHVNTPTSSRFNRINDRAFMPTEEDIKRIQQ